MVAISKTGKFALQMWIWCIHMVTAFGLVEDSLKKDCLIRYRRTSEKNYQYYSVFTQIDATLQIFQEKSLLELHLTQCQDNSIPEQVFYHLSILEVLNISYTNFTTLPESTFKTQSKLLSLDLSHNMIQDLPNKLLESQRELDDINFSYNNVSLIPENFLCSSGKITIIDFSHNFITNLTENMLQYQTRLQHIDFSHNKIMSVPEKLFSNNSQVIYVDFSHNEIINLPDKCLNNKNNLRTVNFNHNYIIALPEKLFFYPRNMILVNFSHNKIQSLPNQLFRNESSIEVIDFAHNKIESIPHTLLSNNLKIQNINFKNNSINNLPTGIFTEYMELARLDLGYNRLRSLEFLTAPLANLTFLNLKNNRIRTISNTFNSANNLFTLDLSWNYFITLNEETLSPLISLNELKLDGNPFICDCNLHRTAVWCERRNIQIEARCLIQLNNTALSWPDLQSSDICSNNYTMSSNDSSISLWRRISIIFIILTFLLICAISAILIWWRKNFKIRKSKARKDLVLSNGSERTLKKISLSRIGLTTKETRTSIPEESTVIPHETDAYSIYDGNTYQYIDIPPGGILPQRTSCSTTEVIEENPLYQQN